MSIQAIRRRLDRLIGFSGGPPKPPFLAIERSLVKRDAAGQLWRKPFRRYILGNPLVEMIDSDWEQTEEPDNGEKDPLDAEK